MNLVFYEVPEITYKLIEFRSKNHLTQEELAMICDVSIEVVRKIERKLFRKERPLKLTDYSFNLVRQIVYEEVAWSKPRINREGVFGEHYMLEDLDKRTMLKYISAHTTFKIRGVMVKDMYFDESNGLFTINPKLCRVSIPHMYKAMRDPKFALKLEKLIRM